MLIEFLFYAVFLGQVFIISYDYPKKVLKRNDYVLTNYPASEYPKLYQNAYYADPAKVIRKVLSRFRFMNLVMVLLGVGLLLAMAVTGYAPSGIKENQHILLVVVFFFLQIAPHIYIEITTLKWYRLMRDAVKNSVRKADLRPRHLFDFVSPVFVVLAVLLYVAWLVFYLYERGLTTPWEWEQYVTVSLITAVNLFNAVTIFKFVNGKKLDPHQAYDDQLKLIEAMVKVHVFASICMSAFLIIMQLVNTYNLDLFEPVFLSAYFQLIAVFGIGQMMRTFTIDTVDFDVYKEAASPS